MDFSAFDSSRLDEYSARAKAAWGNTAAYKEFEQKAKTRTKEEDALLGEQCMQIFKKLGEIRDRDPGCEEAQGLVAALQQFITEHFYNCTDTILRSLGKMYAGGGDFTRSIDGCAGEGTAAFADRAIQIYCGE